MRAMVVDDSRAIRLILTRALTDLGFEISQAASGNEALSLLGDHVGQPSLILVDWNMPGISGLDFIRHVRADSTAASTALVMVTTETEIEQIAIALEAGAADKLRLLGLVG
jgi:two-component system, chemotaxis family, chemotaxis protein CheY